MLETDILASVFKSQSAASVGASEELETLTDDQANLACEVLKALFNTIIHANLSDLEGVSIFRVQSSGVEISQHFQEPCGPLRVVEWVALIRFLFGMCHYLSTLDFTFLF